jgi:hypothetical protein
VYIARKLMDLQAKWRGELSARRLVGKLIEEKNLAFGKSTGRWFGALGMKRFHPFLKPTPIRRHHVARLKHSMDEPLKDDGSGYMHLVSAGCVWV